MALPMYQVDAFTPEPFQGNPAAVVILPSDAFHSPNVSDWMLRVAAENNLSETAFVCEKGTNEYHLRWFTPTTEIELCGHATLASAHVLFETQRVARDAFIRFYTLSGVLTCSSTTSPVDSSRPMVQMDFPLQELTSSTISSKEVANALNIPSSNTISLQTSPLFLLVHVDPPTFESVQPNFKLLMEIEANAVIVTAKPSADRASNLDFQSRCFGPRLGIDEDPVTGSAHCALATYWSKLLGKKELYAQQTCPKRGGFVGMRLQEDDAGRVMIQGEAVTVFSATLNSAPQA